MKWDHKKIQEEIYISISMLNSRIEDISGKPGYEDNVTYQKEIDDLLGKLLLYEDIISNVAISKRTTFIACLERRSSVFDFEVKDLRVTDTERVKKSYRSEASEYLKSLLKLP